MTLPNQIWGIKYILGAFTGDNPSSLAGLGIRKGDLGYSLGNALSIYLSTFISF